MQQLGYRMEEMIFTLADQNFFFNEIEVRGNSLTDIAYYNNNDNTQIYNTTR